MSAIQLIDGTEGARLLVKPAFGSPYNGCGYCCADEPYAIAREHIFDHPEEGPASPWSTRTASLCAA